MSLVVLGALAAGGALAGYGWWRGQQKRALRQTRKAMREAPPSSGFEPGEVLGIRGRDYWLTDGVWLKEDDQLVATLFWVDAARLVVLPGPTPHLYLGRALSLTLPPELPERILLDHTGFVLVQRQPVQALAFGDGQREKAGLWARYTTQSEQSLWVLRLEQQVTALLTERVGDSEPFRWGKVRS